MGTSKSAIQLAQPIDSLVLTLCGTDRPSQFKSHSLQLSWAGRRVRPASSLRPLASVEPIVTCTTFSFKLILLGGCDSRARICIPLKVPKCEIFDPFFFTSINPIWVGDLRTGEKKNFFEDYGRYSPFYFFFTQTEPALKICLRRLSLR